MTARGLCVVRVSTVIATAHVSVKVTRPGGSPPAGCRRFAYLLAALGGSVAILLLGDVRQPVVGASGAIFGLFAAALAMSRLVGFNTRALVLTVGLNFVFTFSVPGISKLGHVGGFVVGGLASLALLGWSLNKRQPLTNRLRTIQVTSLAGLLALLVALALWRTEQIHDALFRGVSAAASPVASSQHDVKVGRAPLSTAVDHAGENYSSVITGVEEPVDNG